MAKIMHTCSQYAVRNYTLYEDYNALLDDPEALIESLATLIEKFKHDRKKNTFALRNFLEDETNKGILKQYTRDDSFPSFDTVWDGAKSVLIAMEQEADPKVQRADLQLLAQDLNTILGYLCKTAPIS